MKKTCHPAHTRVKASQGWLNANYSFSFAQYYNPKRISFDALRVLNDNTIDLGMGFGTHPHNNIEIITIPLEGDLEHKDSTGNLGTIHENEIQVTTADKGVQHSEYNKNADKSINLLQLWVIPNAHNVAPPYDQNSDRELKKQSLLSSFVPQFT